MALIRTGMDATKFFITLLVVFIAVQSGNWIVSKYVPEFEFLKMGWILFMFLAVSAIVSIFMLGRKLGDLKKEDLIFIVLQFLAIIGLFIFLPSFLPEIFSTYSLNVSETVREATGSVVQNLFAGSKI